MTRPILMQDTPLPTKFAGTRSLKTESSPQAPAPSDVAVGLRDEFDPIDRAVEAATRAGITVVVAAGNSRPNAHASGSPADAAEKQEAPSKPAPAAQPPQGSLWGAGLTTLAELPAEADLPYASPTRPPAIDFPGDQPEAIMAAIGRHAATLPCIAEGLADAPTMTTGSKTRDKIYRQIEMMGDFGRGDYEALHGVIANDSLPAPLQVSVEDLKAVLEPLREGLTTSDWKVLGAVGVFHDVGKLRPEWATDHGMDLTEVEGIAHDFDSEAILKHNPDLLEPFGLSVDEAEKVRLLCRLHSLPGMHCLGEGNAAAYGPLFETAREEGSENVLKLARAQGLLDVMSAVTTRFVKPILNAHAGLREFVTTAFEQGTPLGVKYRRDCAAELRQAPEFRDVADEFGLGPVAMKRLRALTSPKIEAGVFREALNELDPEMVYCFNRATDDEDTWYGTFVQSAFGSGMMKAKLPPKDIVQGMIKIVACAARYHTQMEEYHGRRGKWALSSLEAQQTVTSGEEGARKVLEELKGITRVDDGVKHLAGSGATGLTMRSGRSGVEIGFLATA